MRIKFHSPYQAEVDVQAELINKRFKRGEVRTVPDDIGRILLRNVNFSEVTDDTAATQPEHAAENTETPPQAEPPATEPPHAPTPESVPESAHDHPPDAEHTPEQHPPHSEEA